MPTTKTFIHAPLELPYGDLKVVTTPKGRKYVTPEDKTYDSITTILGYLKKEDIREWRQRVGEEEANRISSFAAGRGNALHGLMEKYIQNEPVEESSLMPHVKCLYRQARTVVDKHIGKIYLQEKPLYSDHLGVAGRVDLVCDFASRTSIVDFKSSTRKKTREEIETYFMQACAYSIMVEERTGIPVPRLVIIMAVDNSPDEALVFVERRDTWVPKLFEALDTYRKAKLFNHL